MIEQPILYHVDRNLAWITLNRPHALNALNAGMLAALGDAFTEAADDPAVGAIILTGTGKRAFSAGADIDFLSRADPLEIRDLARQAVDLTRKIESLPKVVIAAINGYALGGGLEIAESCTLRIAARGVRLGHPEVRIGAVAGWGGTTRLARLVGRGRATEMLLTGELVDSEEALRIGLVNRVAHPDDLLREAQRLAESILANSPRAVRLTWEALHRGLDLSVDESARLGADFFGLVATTDDFREGTRAFLEKRAPRYAAASTEDGGGAASTSAPNGSNSPSPEADP